ncbi:glutathione S-transferase C-terminal domain-containing protein [Pikeienuella piscinae]|nr:glutathione S-transferase C-terminal domain-containing protein [Pikeienuella piscinae]
MTAHEVGVNDLIERTVSNPWNEENQAAAVNPAGKVPALVLDDGLALYDSPVICEYLDNLGQASSIFPAAGIERWRALQRQALGDALLDAMIARRLESRRPDNERSEGWIARQVLSVNRCLDAMEADASELSEQPTIGHIAYFCALAHLDFRFADENWRPGRPKLEAWFATFESRPSAQSTIPHD